MQNTLSGVHLKGQSLIKAEPEKKKSKALKNPYLATVKVDRSYPADMNKTLDG